MVHAQRPHLGVGCGLRCSPHQRWLRVQCLQITTNRQGLGNGAAVIELEYGQLAQGVEPQEIRLCISAAGGINFASLDRNTFFSHEDAHAPGVHSCSEIVKNHGLPPIG